MFNHIARSMLPLCVFPSEATWEPEWTMRAQYPQLFDSSMNFEDEILLRGGELKHPELDPNSFIAIL